MQYMPSQYVSLSELLTTLELLIITVVSRLTFLRLAVWAKNLNFVHQTFHRVEGVVWARDELLTCHQNDRTSYRSVLLNFVHFVHGTSSSARWAVPQNQYSRTVPAPIHTDAEQPRYGTVSLLKWAGLMTFV